MLKCPKCKTEYQEGSKTCSDCGSELIEQAEVEGEKSIKGSSFKDNNLKVATTILDRKLNLLFGFLGGLFLVCLRLPQINLYSALGSFQGYMSEFITGVLSGIGLVFCVFFSCLLIIDTLKTMYRS